MYEHGIACSGENAIQKCAIGTRSKIRGTPQPRSRYRGIFSQARTENSRSFFHVHWVPLFFRFM